MRPLPALPFAALLAASIAALVAGCSSVSCGANAEKLEKLKPGLTREETAEIMGCPGKPVGDESQAAGSFRTVEWSGPGSLLMSRTYVVFQNDRLYTYETEKRGGF
jgi:hypothetical protein